jgi:hypothetical protein
LSLICRDDLWDARSHGHGQSFFAIVGIALMTFLAVGFVASLFHVVWVALPIAPLLLSAIPLLRLAVLSLLAGASVLWRPAPAFHVCLGTFVIVA